MSKLPFREPLVTTLLLLACACLTRGADVLDTVKYPLPSSTYTAYCGRVSLPADGIWQPRAVDRSSVKQVYLLPSDQVLQQQLGRRMGAAVRQSRIDRGRWKVSAAYRPFREYALAHDNLGPESVDQLDQEQYRYFLNSLDTSPWNDRYPQPMGEVKGPFVYFVASAPFSFNDDERPRVPHERRALLAFELRPYVDDGQHWVLYTDGTCVREQINQDRIRQHAQTIRPATSLQDSDTIPSPASLTYTLVVVGAGDAMELSIPLVNTVIADEHTVVWDTSGAARDDSALATLRRARKMTWEPYLAAGSAPILRAWTSATRPREQRAAQRNELSAFSLLGGRAAVEETLQLQGLNVVASENQERVSVDSLEGVTVKSHPYQEMLGQREGGELALANFAPTDCFFVYVGKPNSIVPFLDKGAAFMAAAGAGVTGNRLDYGLEQRYLNRLGMNRQWIEQILRVGLVREMALSMPDLFLIDGTDITVTARLAQPQLLRGLISTLGVKGLSDDGVAMLSSRHGEQSFWALRGDLLCVSTNRQELDRALHLIEYHGEGSLGQSAEFRYMLMQIPVEDTTRIFAYFSDPFIRRLVGPQVKLAQQRRIRERAEMEWLTAQLLRARLDGTDVGDSSDKLRELGYLPSQFPRDKYSFDNLGLVSSRRYGPLPRMKTLPEVPVQDVTADEAQAYERYVQNYSRYWRQFFDPIAIRVNELPDDSLEITTFILPLIDSSIYNGLRDAMMHHEDQQSLQVPVLEPPPVLQFSANLSDAAWQRVASDFSDFFQRYSGASPAILDDLGPSVHLAVFDADPVIALGSGDLMGAFGGNTMRMGGNQMMALPIALSLLTRPCTILVETRDAERTARYLRQAASGWATQRSRNPMFPVSFYQQGQEESWVWMMNIAGVVKLRYGIEVTDRYLVIRNIPWSTKDRVTEVVESPLNGAALIASPSACRLQLPGLFASAADQERRAVMSGTGRLYPLLLSGAATVETAGDLHHQLFGFRPVHPPSGEWRWQDQHLESSEYGTVWRQQQPTFDPKLPTGLMQNIDQVRLNMQFEDAGLRSIISWRVGKSK